MGWNPDFVGQVATYSTAIAEAPGSPAEGFYAMTPALYAYPDDPRPAVQAFAAKYKARYGFDVNFLGETGYTAAQFVLAMLDKAARDLTLDSFINASARLYRITLHKRARLPRVPITGGEF